MANKGAKSNARKIARARKFISAPKKLSRISKRSQKRK